MKFLTRALVSMGVNEFYLEFDGIPSNEEEFNQAFYKTDSDGVHHHGMSNISPITWDQINTKASELRAGEPLRLLKVERNRLLTETDWTQNGDVSDTVKGRFISYRQALRDIIGKLCQNNKLKTIQPIG